MTTDATPAAPLDVRALKTSAGLDAAARHNGYFPEGYRLYFRRYGKYGGRWRGVGPNGWVESPHQEHATSELWWMVAADEKDKERADAV